GIVSRTITVTTETGLQRAIASPSPRTIGIRDSNATPSPLPAAMTSSASDDEPTPVEAHAPSVSDLKAISADVESALERVRVPARAAAPEPHAAPDRGVADARARLLHRSDRRRAAPQHGDRSKPHSGCLPDPRRALPARGGGAGASRHGRRELTDWRPGPR